MSWYYLYIDDPHESFTRSGEFTDAMVNVGLAAVGSDAAIYAHQDWKTGGTHYHFTPRTKPVALIFGARPWNQPSSQAVGDFVVGDPGLFRRLYP